MSKILLIFKNSILRNRLTVILALVTAALMSFIFYAEANADGAVYAVDEISVGLVDGDNSALSENLGEYFGSLGIEVLRDNYDNLSHLLINRDISAIIEVPDGFEGSAVNGAPEKLSITALDDYANSAFIEAYTNSYMRGVSIIARAADGNAQAFAEMLSSQTPPDTVTLAETNSRTDKRAQTADAYNMSVGFMLMLISGITVFISNQILIDRQLGTFDRMKCSSITSSEYVVGVGAFGIVCCTAVNLIFNLFAYSTAEEMPVPFPVAVGATELFMLFTAGMALLFALLVTDRRSLISVGVGYATIGSMLGGAWFPITIDLGFVGGIAKLFPQYWLMDMIRKYGEPDLNVLLHICILALSAVLTYLVSAAIFTRKNT